MPAVAKDAPASGTRVTLSPPKLNRGLGPLPSCNLSQGLHLHRQDCGKVPHDWRPTLSRIGRRVNLSAAGAEIDPAFVERIHRHRISQNVHVTVALRQTFGERFPLIAAGAAAIHAQPAIRNKMLGVALDRNDIEGLRFVGVNIDDESEIAWAGFR